ncbi:hypothetical protein ACIA74_44930 [Streptomyces sp. NPDC051658]|uniref:hypothetical protein n=1 Tax=Streptomyces sp. NPDC051658 TaxID=3365667 RepID=UPI003789AE2D
MADECLGLGRCPLPVVLACGISCPGAVVTERQEELLFGEGRHPDADRIERKRLGDGADPETAWLDTVLGKPVEGVKKRKQTPLLAVDSWSGRRRP